MATTLEAPRSPAPTHPRRRFNVEKYGWIYMRASGVVLIVLIFGHLFVNLVAGQGVKQVDFGFIAGKYATPFWRTITNDYVTRPMANRLLKGALVTATVLLIALGTMVVFTFEPCPANGLAANLPSFCAAAR